MTQNLTAFLGMIRHSEGTDKAPDPYRVVYGYGYTIKDLREHPGITGEWHGEKLSDERCIAVGLHPGCVSSAAGAYQIILPTWRTCKSILRLPDFTGPSQDAAATELIREAGALDMVNAGQVADAITKCHGIWASLPGPNIRQPQRSFADLINAYASAGGAFA